MRVNRASDLFKDNKKKNGKSKELIVSFMHSNYCVRPAGTEKFLKNFSIILQKNGFNHLNFFSFYSHKGILGEKIVGVNYNDKFIGIFSYKKIETIIDAFIHKYCMHLNSFHFQHLLNHSLDLIEKLVYKYKVPVIFFIHDFYIICCQPHLVNSYGKFCGITRPNIEKCKECEYKKLAIIHFTQMNLFIENIIPYIRTIITPSEFVENGIKAIFPQCATKVIIRAHLCFKGHTVYQSLEGKIRIAFAGRQSEEKGFRQWKQLIKVLYPKMKEQYEFYYFGIDNEQISGVTNVRVSIAEQGKNAMIDNLKKHNIVCALIWPSCAETYSYIYYELALCGVFVLTNETSGNIALEVAKNKNGKIFSDFNICLDWLQQIEVVYDCINNYRLNPIFAPKISLSNESMKYIIENNLYEVNNYTHTSMPCKKILQTTLYMKKYRKELYCEDKV